VSSAKLSVSAVQAQGIFVEVDMEAKKAAFSKAELAEQLGVSRDSVSRAIDRKEIKVIRFGRRVLIPQSELARVLNQAK
jgi:excisionase family DNA binding protein